MKGNVKDVWKDMRLEVYAQATGNRHEPNMSDDTTKMYSLNDIDEIIEKIADAMTYEPQSMTHILINKEKPIKQQAMNRAQKEFKNSFSVSI